MLSLLFGLAIACLLAEGCARIYFSSSSHREYETTRLLLAGEAPDTGERDGVMGQPYLLYVPAPGYRDHNEQGYRGRAVPMQRTPGVSRVLCLGGSTTYGYMAKRPGSSYPAQLEEILKQNLPTGVDDVEVINAGVVDATTAELLTHYHFKFHYFHPDVVVINTGRNDPEVGEYYQPDYSHVRHPMQVPQPLSQFGRTVIQSRFAALIVLKMLYGRNPGNAWIERDDEIPPPTVWHPNAKDADTHQTLADAEIAFTHNLSTLINEIEHDGARVLLVPVRLNPHKARKEEQFQYIARHEEILSQLALQHELLLAPFPADVITPRNWADGTHLNSDGSREKAEYLARYVRRLLWPDASAQAGADGNLPTPHADARGALTHDQR
jgi:lysophospholipase L1-like esterase